MAPLVSIQLYTARNRPLAEALETIAALGYDAVQPYAVQYAADCEGFRQLLDTYKLPLPTVHMELADLTADFGRWLGMARTLGSTSITIAHPLPSDRLETRDDWERWAEALAAMARRVQSEGLRLGWGNHDFEYRGFDDGVRPIDIILQYPDIDYELVLGWLLVTGQDIGAEFRRYGDRIRTLRLRDCTADRPGQWVAIGDGDIGYPEIASTIRALPNLRELVVDHDLPADFTDFARRSLATVKTLLV